MKKLAAIACAFLALGATACGGKQQEKSENPEAATPDKKVLVTYFSATGTTKDVAERIAEAVGADLAEIAPAEVYTEADLDWHDKTSRSSVEMADENSRPAIKEMSVSPADYDVIFVGFPVWWDLAPRQVNTFIESNELAGKTIVPFATSGGSSIDNSVKDLRRLYPSLTITDGRLLNNESKQTISDWALSEI